MLGMHIFRGKKIHCQILRCKGVLVLEAGPVEWVGDVLRASTVQEKAKPPSFRNRPCQGQSASSELGNFSSPAQGRHSLRQAD